MVSVVAPRALPAIFAISPNSLLAWLGSSRSGVLLQGASSASPAASQHRCLLRLLPSSLRTRAACRILLELLCTISLGIYLLRERLCLSTPRVSFRSLSAGLLGPGSAARALATRLDCWTSIPSVSLLLLLGGRAAHSSTDRRYTCPHCPKLAGMQCTVPARSWLARNAHEENIFPHPCGLGTTVFRIPRAPWPGCIPSGWPSDRAGLH